MAWTELQLVDALEVALIDNSPFLGLSGLSSWPPEALSEMEDAMERIADPIYNFVESWAIEPGTLELSYQFKTDLEDPLPGYLEDKIDDSTLKINPTTRRLYVAHTPVATDTIVGGVTIGAQPFLYLNGSDLMLNAEESPLLEGGNDMVPTSRAVKLYVDSFITGGGAGGGDMLKSTYDTADNGVVDDADRLGNQLPSYYLSWANFTGTPTTVAGYGITNVYTEAEIDAFFEGEVSGKKQVHWDRIISAPTIPVDHADLNSLTADDHDQYALLLGRTGDVLHMDEIQEYTTDAGVTFSDVIYATGTTGIGTGTSILYFNRGTGEITYGDSPEGSGYPDIYYEVTCTNNTTTNIVVGDTAVDTIGIQILYSIIRGSLYETGEIHLVNRSGTISLNRSSYFDNSGVTIATDTSGTDIRLNVTVPSGSDAVFEYVKILQEGPNEWIGLNAPLRSQALTPSATTLTLLGNTSDHTSMKVQYGIIRDDTYQIGEIFVMNKGGTLGVELGSVGGNAGCTFDAEINNGFIYLKSTLTSGNIAAMDYHVVYIDGPRQWDVNEGAERTATLTDDAQTDLLLGNIYNDIGIEVIYNLTRSTSRQTGKIFVSDNGTTSPDQDRSSFGDDCGETMEVVVDTSGNYILESTLTSTGNNATFEYTILPLSRPNAAGGYWDRTGTTLTTLTAGDDVDLSGKLKIDQIGEHTLDAGIIIEGLTLKDTDITIPTAGRVYFNVGETTSVYDNAGVLTFVDGTTGIKTLADLATVGNPSYGNNNEIPVTNSTTNDFDYTSNFVYDGSDLILTSSDIVIATIGGQLRFGDGDTGFWEASDDNFYLSVGNLTAVIWNLNTSMDVYGVLNVNEIIERSPGVGVTIESMIFEDNTILFNQVSAPGAPAVGDGILYMNNVDGKVYFRTNSQNYDLTISATGYWNRVSTTVSPATPGDDVEIDGGILTVNTINEYGTGVGVTVEGLTLEDNTILFNEVTTPSAPAANDGILYMNSTDEKLYFRTNSTTYDLTSTSAGYWSRSGTDLTPLNGGDDILLAVSTETIKFGDGDTYIFENADDDFQIYVGAALEFRIHTTGVGIGSALYPMGTQDIGTGSAYWDDAFITRIYIGSASQYIDVSGSDLRFTDSLAGTQTLSNLISGSGDVSHGTGGSNARIAFFDTDAYTISGDSRFTWTSASDVLTLNDTTGVDTIYSTFHGTRWRIHEYGASELVDLNPSVADGASAIAFDFDSSNNLSIAGAKLVSVSNNASEKFYIDKDGNVNIPTGADYLINGTSVTDGYVSMSSQVLDGIVVSTSTSNVVESVAGFTYNQSRLYLQCAATANISISDGLYINQYGNNSYPAQLHLSKQRTASTAVNNDYIGTINFLFFNNAGTPEQMEDTFIRARVLDVSSVSEDTEIYFSRYEGGVATEYSLDDLLTGGASPEYGADNQIPFMNGTTEFDYSINLSWTGSVLDVGGDIEVGSPGISGLTTYGAVKVGSATLNQFGTIELWGNRASDSTVGNISFHNSASGATYDRIGLIQCYRDGDNDAGQLRFHATNTAGVLQYQYRIDGDEHVWLLGGVNKFNFKNDVLAPIINGGIDLGTTALAWDTLYVNNIRIESLSGTGIRLVGIEPDGDIVSTNVTFSGDTIYADHIRMDSLSGTGTRMVTTDADGDLGFADLPSPASPLSLIAPGVLITKREATAYCQDGALDEVFSISISEADFMGDYDGDRQFRLTVAGTVEADSSGTWSFILQIGGTDFETVTFTITDGQYRIEYIFAGYSSNYGTCSATMMVSSPTHSTNQTKTYLANSVNLSVINSISLDVDTNLSSAANPAIYVNLCQLEILEEE